MDAPTSAGNAMALMLSSCKVEASASAEGTPATTFCLDDLPFPALAFAFHHAASQADRLPFEEHPLARPFLFRST